MMDCAQAVELLVAHSDGELEPKQARELEAHLAGCPGCRQERERVAALLTLTALWQPRPVQAAPAGGDAPGPSPRAPAVMTPEELMVYLRIDEAHFAAILPDLPKVNLGGLWRFRRSSIDAWLARREQDAWSERGAEGARAASAPGPLIPQCAVGGRTRLVLL